MSKLDLVILTEDDIPEPSSGDTRLEAEEHGLEEDIEKLARAWPILMERLKALIDSTDEEAESSSGFHLESIEFQIGIEAGFTFGFTGTANAAFTATFSRKEA